MDIKRNEAQNIIKKILSSEKSHFRKINLLYNILKYIHL